MPGYYWTDADTSTTTGGWIPASGYYPTSGYYSPYGYYYGDQYISNTGQTISDVKPEPEPEPCTEEELLEFLKS